MNIVHELRKKKGIQQKELAMALGVSIPTISNWENGKSDPSGERLKKLAEYFGVDELFILGYGIENPTLFIPENPKTAGKSEADQIVQYVLEKLNEQQTISAVVPSTPEARAVSFGMDTLPQEQRELILNMVTAMFPENFKKGSNDNDT